ncbi:MAG: 50S ribosomal protein L29 [Planctomycetota bacterium]
MPRRDALEEMRGKDSRELRYDLESTRKELFEARLQVTESGKDSDLRGLRRRIARILTVLGSRKESAPGSEPGSGPGRTAEKGSAT